MNEVGVIKDFDYDVAVVGLGYVGLPILRASRLSGLGTLGYDVNESLIVQLKLEEDPLPTRALPYDFTTDPKQLSDAKVICVCVPTPLSSKKAPDLSAVLGAAEKIGRNLRAGQLVILESTTFPGTTEGIFRAKLELHSGLEAGLDFDLAYSPERIDPGNSVFSIENTPKVVGALTDEGLNRATNFYSRFVNQVVPAKSLKTAEASKILENTYRHINISFINEFAMACDALGLDVYEVIELASTKPFGFQKFSPGPGSGGHCIPVDPNYFLYALKNIGNSNSRFIELATQTNQDIAEFINIKGRMLVEDLAVPILKAKVLVLGLSYKANSSDMRESPAERIVALLKSWSKSVALHDPALDGAPIWGSSPTIKNSDLNNVIAEADLILVLQPHLQYLQIADRLEPYSHKLLTAFKHVGFPGKSVYTNET